ncbi:TetR/AcrR family transcriptional regulator [Roseomonas rosulenta]|uniref:TetR/AcrR family transcriptional regulator n=1 Tax=Roseomonas rosulenta TaxID=2748667 RepID=UPI0018DF324B|nr:TetR/AcrR family transcriptional regulator [Roseomonas rosulenta]
MPRPRAFDLDRVIDQAMAAFWRRGYGETSMADIYAATGLKPGSLYGVVRGKEDLFRLAFDRYAEHFRATLPQAAEGLDAIAAWLETQRRLAVEDPQRRGCLIVNTTLERDVHAEATRALAQARLAEIRGFFLRHLAIARERGEIARETDLDRQADALLGTVVAIMSLARAGADARTIANLADAAIAPLRQAAGRAGSSRDQRVGVGGVVE